MRQSASPYDAYRACPTWSGPVGFTLTNSTFILRRSSWGSALRPKSGPAARMRSSAAWYRGAVERMRAAGPDFGRDALPHDERLKMNVEFVSVNPTGPLHVGHARYASYGDALCRIFAFVGHDVTREFYVNDYGTQMLRFGQSLAARYGQRLDLDTPVPEEGYQGEYLLDLADDLIAAVGDRYRAAVAAAAPDVTALAADALAAIKEWGRDAILAQFRVTLQRLRVPFDVWAYESSLYAGDGEHRGFAGVQRALV